MAPEPQKHRKIGFYLDGGGPATSWTFAIRPEELNRQEPSRLTVQPTLGGAWADTAGRDVSTITLEGHTGWRDGAGRFETLRATVFKDWHDRRILAAARGQDPDDVALYFADTLDRVTALVAPKSFALKRSKASPLLMRYKIELAVLDDEGEPASAPDAITGALFDPLRWMAARLGLEKLVAEIGVIIDDVQRLYADAADAVTQICVFMQSCAQRALDAVDAVEGGVDRLTAPFLETVQRLAEAARNGIGALARVQSASPVKSALMRAASTMNDIACTLANGFGVSRQFASYDDLYGASSCSSTGGGRGWSTFAEEGSNPFHSLFPPVAARLTLSTSGRDALDTLRRDPLGLTPTTAAAALAALAAGATLP